MTHFSMTISQDRITDHRIQLTVHGIINFLQTGTMLADIITQLRLQDEAKALTTVLNEIE